ncbi:hypothetical protein JCM6882_006027 [Rhodosporidiobolus microsporus]
MSAQPASPPQTLVDEEKRDYTPSKATSDDGTLVTEKSRGVVQMERLTSRLTTPYRTVLYISFALLAYIMSLDQYTNGSYLSAATSYSFAAHSTLTTISSLKSVFQAVSQPPVAKIGDVAGRLEAYSLCLFLYVIGYIVVASAPSIYAYAAGAAINVLGITGLFLLQNIIIADLSSLRNRLFWSIFPSLPGTINVWVSGNITQDFLGKRQENNHMWRWGIGMFCILTPALAIPVMLSLGIGMRKVKNEEGKTAVVPRRSDGSRRSIWDQMVAIFWQLDLIGLLLLVGGFGMVLTIITIANGKGSHWSDPHSIALLTVGGVLIIAFVCWETFGARHPLLSFGLLKNRTVICCFALALLHPVASGVIGSYFYTYMLVAADETTLSATRIRNISSFTATWTAAAMGIVARYIRRLKPIIIIGFCIELLAFGLMVRYRSAGAKQGDLAGVQVLRGFGAGCLGFPIQAAIQSVSKREHLGAITSSYLLIYYLAGGIGSAVGGGIWSNLVPGKMEAYLPNSTIAGQAYSNPLGLIATHPPGDPIRDAMSRAHGETQRILSITACAIAAVGLVVACFLQNVKLTDEVTLEEVEKADDGKLASTR